MKPLRLLVVEDVENDAALVLRELSKGDYEVAHRRVDTLQGFRDALNNESWDLIVSDFSLPTMTAMDVLDILTASGLDVPCIIISGTIEEESAVEAMKRGASDFVAKDRLARLLPAVSRELREAVQRRQKRAAEAALAQAQKMDSIGSLAGGIAHDFNNLLTVILGFTNFILEGVESNNELDPTQLRTDLEEIRKAGERAAALTSQLLAFSRKQIIQPTILNINTVVGNIEQMLRRLIGEDINLLVRCASDLGSATVDAGQIEQVIMNLIVNARDATPSGGRITLETANIDLDQTYAREHLSVVPGPYVMLAVSDTGIGMTAEVQARIFEPFFTTKPKGRGTGLGLATIYGIVKQSDGNIWVYSEPGMGTTFKVYLPRTSGAPESVQPKADTAIRGGHETILLVEDDERVRKLVHEMLIRSGYTVILASNSEEALRLATSVTDRVDLLLTDVVMPGMSGRLLAERISDRHPEIRVLYMSGYTDDAIVHHGVLDPGVAFLQKPFTPATFARAIRDALETRT